MASSKGKEKEPISTSNLTPEPTPPQDPGIPIKPYRGRLPPDLATTVTNDTVQTSRSYTEGRKLQLGAKPRGQDDPKAIFAERVYLPKDIHILVIHPILNDELPRRLTLASDLRVVTALCRHLRWRNSQQCETEAERLARYQSVAELRFLISMQGHLPQPEVSSAEKEEDQRYEKVEAEEGFVAFGPAGTLMRKGLEWGA